MTGRPNGSVLAAIVSSTGAAGPIAGVSIVKFKPDEKATLQTVVHTSARDGEGGAALSPDGRWLAYTSAATGHQEIWVQPFGSTGAPVRVSPDGGLDPRWAPDGRELYYRESNRLTAVAVKKGTAFDFAAPTLVLEDRLGQVSYDVGPDGRFLMMAYGPFVGRSPIQIVLNWSELLTGRKPRE